MIQYILFCKSCNKEIDLLTTICSRNVFLHFTGFRYAIIYPLITCVTHPMINWLEDPPILMLCTFSYSRGSTDAVKRKNNFWILYHFLFGTSMPLFSPPVCSCKSLSQLPIIALWLCHVLPCNDTILSYFYGVAHIEQWVIADVIFRCWGNFFNDLASYMMLAPPPQQSH